MKYKNVLKSCVHLRTLIGADEAESRLNPHFLKDFQPIRDPDASLTNPSNWRVLSLPGGYCSFASLRKHFHEKVR